MRVALPPLRQRQDFAAAVRWVLRTLDRHADIDNDAVQALARHAWPGNFRELRSMLTRMLLSREGQRSAIGVPDVQCVLQPTGTAAASGLQRQAAELVREKFLRHGRSVSAVSRALGISRTTVYRHLRAAGIIAAGPAHAAHPHES